MKGTGEEKVKESQRRGKTGGLGKVNRRRRLGRGNKGRGDGEG